MSVNSYIFFPWNRTKQLQQHSWFRTLYFHLYKIVRRKRETWNKKKRTKEEKNDFHNNKKEENENFRYLALIGVMVSC